jgi:hypothetical protein
MRQLADDIKTYIDTPGVGAPVRTGRLREASHAEYDDSSDSVIVGVEEDVEYARFIIEGTEYMEENDYLSRAVEYGLEILNARNHV